MEDKGEKMNETIKISVDYYEKDDQVITFVNGYALREQIPSVAYKLAKAAGQAHLPICTYPANGSVPIHTKEAV